jgi:tryptophan halogenase
MPIPESLQHRIELFKQTGKVFQKAGDVFAENSWTQVMLGQGLMPEQYHSIVNMMSDQELKSFLENIKHNVDRLVEQLPNHKQFVDNYCKAEAM